MSITRMILTDSAFWVIVAIAATAGMLMEYAVGDEDECNDDEIQVITGNDSVCLEGEEISYRF